MQSKGGVPRRFPGAVCAETRFLQISLQEGTNDANCLDVDPARPLAGDRRECVDYLNGLPDVDRERLGATGVSGGGWQTIVVLFG